MEVYLNWIALGLIGIFVGTIAYFLERFEEILLEIQLEHLPEINEEEAHDMKDHPIS